MTERFEGTCIKYCKGACCRNAVLHDMTDAEFEVVASNSPIRSREKNYSAILTTVYHSQLRNGIYFITNEDGTHDVGIKGNCPNLLPNGACGIYEERPSACRSLEVGDSGCRFAREKLRMKPLGKVIG